MNCAHVTGVPNALINGIHHIHGGATNQGFTDEEILMQDKKNTALRNNQADSQATQQIGHIEADIPQVSSVRDYVRMHTMDRWAANDSHRFALADFLIQHQRQRANAELEPENEKDEP